jgi:hypothetical protein
MHTPHKYPVVVQDIDDVILSLYYSFILGAVPSVHAGAAKLVPVIVPLSNRRANVTPLALIFCIRI